MNTTYATPQYLTTEIGREEIAALNWRRRRNYRGQSTVAINVVAATVFRAALAYPEELSKWIAATANYREAEGFSRTYEGDKTVARSRIAGRREYRKELRSIVRCESPQGLEPELEAIAGHLNADERAWLARS